MQHRSKRWAVAGAALATLAAVIMAAPAGAAPNGYRQTNIVSDQPGHARLTDPDLVNAWGLAAGPTTPIWVANNGTSTATIYSGAVGGTPAAKVPLTVAVNGQDPTGQVFNPTGSFRVRVDGKRLPATFIFDAESGTVSAWPASNPPTTTAPVVASVRGAIFKGLTMGFVRGRGPLLYAADFHHGQIVVLNGRFRRVHLAGGFRDSQMPPDFAPFNVQNLGGRIYVTFAKQGSGPDEVDAPHLGRLDVFNRRGHLLRRLARGGPLDAPWGMAMAPANFGRFSGTLLVGNFGNGHINAFDPATGHFLGMLRRPSGRPLVIDGLWGLRFGNGVFASRRSLVFSAGPDDESHGLLGIIRAAG
ncbi:MAG TPA: TIGR03118 family protein [Gaiellales bacterium]|jgi:uncharacterized protein (TIGR03118 family)|nr:TIGR03118 family protein [Gaiellales bacterium]